MAPRAGEGRTTSLLPLFLTREITSAANKTLFKGGNLANGPEIPHKYRSCESWAEHCSLQPQLLGWRGCSRGFVLMPLWLSQQFPRGVGKKLSLLSHIVTGTPPQRDVRGPHTCGASPGDIRWGADKTPACPRALPGTRLSVPPNFEGVRSRVGNPSITPSPATALLWRRRFFNSHPCKRNPWRMRPLLTSYFKHVLRLSLFVTWKPYSAGYFGALQNDDHYVILQTAIIPARALINAWQI